jgi:hypothetical protein
VPLAMGPNSFLDTCSPCCVSKAQLKYPLAWTPPIGPGDEVLGICVSRRITAGFLGASEIDDLLYQFNRIAIDGDDSLRMELSQRNVKRPFPLPVLTKSFQLEVAYFPQTHAGGAQEHERQCDKIALGFERRLKRLVDLSREGFGQSVVLRREVISSKEIFRRFLGPA